MAPSMEPMHTLAQVLDGIDIALCVFDADDRALVWNRTFLRLFPEHRGHIHTGEHYRDNLRRFYSVRLSPDELPHIDTFIETGVARHQAQSRPYEFEHRERLIRVSSLPLPGGGRVRLWRADKALLEQDAPGPLRLTDAPGTSTATGAVLLDSVPDGLMIATPDGVIQWVNEPFVLMYGLPRRSVAVGVRFEDVYRLAWSRTPPPGETTQFESGLVSLAENLRFSGAPFELPLPGLRWVRVIARPADDGMVFFAHVDISALKRQQRQLAEAERAARQSEALLRQKSQLLRATLDNMQQGVTMINAQGRIEIYNRRTLEILGLPESVLQGKPLFWDVVARQRAEGEFEQAPETVMRHLAPDALEQTEHRYERQRPDGRIVEVRAVPLPEGGQLRTFSDITEQRQTQERIRHAANHDSLTGLMNRGRFLEHLASEIALCARGGTGCAVLYLDLDGFKPINDRHGHAVGDHALVTLARRMQQAARESDFVARLGGDEFAVLQRGIQSTQETQALAERLLAAIGQQVVFESRILSTGVSIGVALCPQDASEPDALLRAADMAMYAAKAAGRQAIRWANPDTLARP